MVGPTSDQEIVPDRLSPSFTSFRFSRISFSLSLLSATIIRTLPIPSLHHSAEESCTI